MYILHKFSLLTTKMHLFFNYHLCSGMPFFVLVSTSLETDVQRFTHAIFLSTRTIVENLVTDMRQDLRSCD